VLLTTPPTSLTSATLRQGVRALAAEDAGLGAIVARHGHPPMWGRPRGFATLVRIILEQQVSLASAATMYARIERALGGMTPPIVRAAGVAGLQALGVTRQKSAYIAALAERVADGSLPLAALHRLPDAEVAAALVRVPGIGPWTASIYLLMALRRPDVWPPGDLALHKAMARLPGFSATPSSEQAAEWALRLRPWRAVAARILWHGYLSDRARPTTSTTAGG
jgi:DNA-3-methyladenine glycosylase II